LPKLVKNCEFRPNVVIDAVVGIVMVARAAKTHHANWIRQS